ncbi:Rpn family recombination-promoting nuclease/putative transposase [Haliovirga abyssi]|uniref:Transposase n=1 Tax=Haliovirga abyssi TaxID=2996794 RepID=A0AAU9DDB6_9FUSO|nr:Rpn family recombination-promoting nuclease/putative transposase [Haliovirga abyssi]BDU51340.1 transposase [Haliovirga abyssi]
MGKLVNPHDKYVKEILTKKDNAKSFLENYLGKDIYELINLEELEIEKDSYVTEELQEYFTDLLYKVKISGEESYIYFLFEHKSYPDKLIMLQLLEYMLKIWKSKMKQKEKLPIILPLVIYHGKKVWNIEEKFSDMLKLKDDKLKKYIPDFQYMLYDLSKYKDSEIVGVSELKAMMKLLKYIYSSDLLIELPTILKLLSNSNIDAIKSITIYLLNTTEIDDKKLIELIKENVSEEGGKIAMTTAERLVEKRIEKSKNIWLYKGREEGKKEGRTEGKKEGMIEGIELALDIKFGKSGLKLMKNITQIENIEKLEKVKNAIRKEDKLENIEKLIKNIEK